MSDRDLRIAQVWLAAIADRRPPNVAVADALGINAVAAAQAVHRMRRNGWDLPDGNTVKLDPLRCPTCGASSSRQRRRRAGTDPIR